MEKVVFIDIIGPKNIELPEKKLHLFLDGRSNYLS
jgi:hypothetical protein